MDKKRLKWDIIINGIIIIMIFSFVIFKGWFRPFSTSFDWKYEKVVIKNDEGYNQNPDVLQLKNGCYRMYTHGWRKNIEENNIYSFYSCDGLKWNFEGLRIKEAAMPATVLLEDGRIRIYFQKGVERDSKPQQALMTAISEDGLNFIIDERYLLVTQEGELKDIKAMAHFEIIKLEKGYRIYFDEGYMKASDFEKYKTTGSNWPVTRIRSVYSEDGFNWTLDKGIRIDFEQVPLTYMQRAGSCTVIKVNNEYQMYFHAGFTPWEDWKPWKRWEWSGVYLATSKDSLNFTITDKRLMTGADPKVIRLGDELRMYVSQGNWFAGTKIYDYFYGQPNNYIFTRAKELK